MSSATEKIKQIIKTAIEYFDQYQPSPHVLYFYWEMGVSDLEWAAQDFKEKMKRHLDALNGKEFPNDVEYDETDPGPIYYLDISNPMTCMEVLEFKLIDAIATQTATKMLLEGLEQQEENGS